MDLHGGGRRAAKRGARARGKPCLRRGLPPGTSEGRAGARSTWGRAKGLVCCLCRKGMDKMLRAGVVSVAERRHVVQRGMGGGEVSRQRGCEVAGRQQRRGRQLVPARIAQPGPGPQGAAAPAKPP